MAGMKNRMTGMDRMILRTWLMLLLLGTLGSCAAPEYKPADREDRAEPQQVTPVDDHTADKAAVPAQELSEDLMYNILLAEIAGQRGALDVSAPHYLQAAEESNDPRVAQRAVQIAMFAKEFGVARQAAHRWVELDGDNLEAHKLLTALALRTGDMNVVIEQMDYLLGITDNPQDGYRLVTAIMASNTTTKKTRNLRFISISISLEGNLIKKCSRSFH